MSVGFSQCWQLRQTPAGARSRTRWGAFKAESYLFSLEMLLRPLVTQMFALSKVTWRGSFPTLKDPSTEPSLARSSSIWIMPGSRQTGEVQF